MSRISKKSKLVAIILIGIMLLSQEFVSTFAVNELKITDKRMKVQEILKDADTEIIKVPTGSSVEIDFYTAVDLEYEGLLYQVGKDGIRITGYVGDKSDLVIPNEINGQLVIEIGDYVFKGHTELKSLVLPKTVVTLGQGIIEGTSIKSITIPKTVKNVKHVDVLYKGGALSGCDSLNKIIFESGTTEIPEYIVSERVNYLAPVDRKLEIVIPEGVTVVGQRAFYACRSLVDIELPNTVEIIDESAFCSTGLKKIILPSSVKSIGQYAFEYCSQMTMYGYSGSYVENYAKNKNIPFKLIDSTMENNQGRIEYFAEWNELEKEVVFGETVQSIPYHITDVTDMSFLESVDNLLCHEVYVQTDGYLVGLDGAWVQKN